MKSQARVDSFFDGLFEAVTAPGNTNENVQAYLITTSSPDLVEFAMILGNQFEGNATIRSVCERAVVDALHDQDKPKARRLAAEYRKFLVEP